MQKALAPEISTWPEELTGSSEKLPSSRIDWMFGEAACRSKWLPLTSVLKSRSEKLMSVACSACAPAIVWSVKEPAPCATSKW